jgi:hypothetical protein
VARDVLLSAKNLPCNVASQPSKLYKELYDIANKTLVRAGRQRFYEEEHRPQNPA